MATLGVCRRDRDVRWLVWYVCRLGLLCMRTSIMLMFVMFDFGLVIIVRLFRLRIRVTMLRLARFAWWFYRVRITSFLTFGLTVLMRN